MKISIFGLGYVGCVSAACLAEAGHEVVGVDVNASKVDMLNRGASPILETDLEEMIRQAVAAGKLRAVTSAEEAVAATDLSLICVGTPSNANNSLNLDFVAKVCEEIGRALKSKKADHVVCVRSTMVPGSTETRVIPALKKGFGKALPTRIRVAVNPEFLREGSAVSDYFNPPKTVVGAADGETADRVLSLYQDIKAPVTRTSLRTAEMTKYVDNVFHALKITFANEIGTLSKAFGVDSGEVMDIFCSDTKLNISDAYLRPGFAFGGSCLPKDLRALLYKGRKMDQETPLLSAILPSNDMQVRRAIDMIQAQGKKRLAFLGLSFKPGTDDLRESPLVVLIETFIGKGYDIRIFDENVSLARLVGANKAYIEKEIPHISSLMTESPQAAVDFGEVIVIGHKEPAFERVLEKASRGKAIVDLVRLFDEPPAGANYHGFNW
ncbi:MAG: UDP-glucose/GDP-mannose dehydrogenase family protein [Candidatus Krumholzibacteria bacterium]